MKDSQVQHRLRQVFILILIFTIVMSLILIIRLAAAPDARIYSHDSAARIHFVGNYQLQGQGEEPLTSVHIPELAEKQPLILRGSFNKSVDEHGMLTLHVNQLSAEIYVNDQLIFQTSSSKADTQIWQTFRTSGISVRDRVEIRLSGFEGEGTSDLRDFLGGMMIGSDYASFYQKITSNLPEVLSASAVLILAILLGLTALIFKKAGISHWQELLLFAGFVWFSGLWFLVDYDYFTLFVPYPTIMLAAELLCAGFIPIFAVAYVLTVLKHSGTRHSLMVNLGILVTVQLINLGFLFINAGKVGSDFYFLLQIILLLLSMFNALCCTFYEARVLKNEEAKSTFILVILVFMGIMLDTLDYFMDFTEHGYLFHAAFLIALLITIVRMINYVISSVRQAGRTAQLENDLLQSQIQVMLSQIRPHFIFNTLNAISALCLTDPLKADETVILFSEYLRENINALETQASISFEQELHHVKNYARIEQIRFGEKLTVEYDIQYKDFEVPTLTLQPVVENAIRHGIGKKHGNGTVWISSKWLDGCAVITVKDDGAGFNMDGDYKRKDSVGMKNVKTRLECMVHARMEISSTPGAGTEVIIRIPADLQKEENAAK